YQPQPMPGVLDDCSYTGNRAAMANWDIFMSVSTLATSSLWDMPRNVSDTYTPDCGLPGDPMGDGPCGSEYKPMVEKQALDESGLDLYWPTETIVDLSPEQNYTGGWYLNMQYVDDQFPGPAFWGRTNPPASLNSLKWIRLACVDPIEASEIRVSPEFFWWPQWVELGQVTNLTVWVQNDGNLTLNVTEIETIETTGSGWLSTSLDWGLLPLVVPPGPINTATFDIIIDATGISSTTWLDGEVVLHSDAINETTTTIDIHLLAAADVEPVRWDTVMSHANMFDMYFFPDGECVALAVSNHGEIGWGAGETGLVNLDYAESETECGERLADAIYLKSGSAFAITADDAAGANAQLTSSYDHPNQYFEHGWDPIGTKGSITGGQGTSYYNGNDYDSVYTGAFVNRDTTIAMERTFYTPRSPDPANETINVVICYTKFYSADGAPHNHVTVGNVCDWNVPSEDINVNTSGVGSSFVYMRGNDTTGVLSCQPNTNRFATESFGGGYTSEEWLADPCVNNQDYQGVSALSQSLLQDTTHYRDGTPLVPPQPNPEVWWDETALGGLNADATPGDQAIWTTYVHDYSLGATDTLHFWTVLTTVRDGNIADLEAQVSYAK
ncbi:MAG: hypothetical protein KAU36_10320, partial [candidate division Zixibacteria bacterium]|nr:hypothetical protein [candidate division Zixibacteria bacterium]